MVLWEKEQIQTLIPALVVMLLVGFGLRLALKNKPEKIRMIPVAVIALLIVALEIGKQALSFKEGYDLYHIPLHFCSLVIFLLPAMAFYKGKHKGYVQILAATVCMSVTLLTVIYPALIYSGGNVRGYFDNYWDFHTVTFHNLVPLATILMLILDLVDTRGKGAVKLMVVFTAVFSLIQGIAANGLKTNFANFYSCNIPPLENVRLMVQGALGYVPAQIFYGIIVGVLQILFMLLCFSLLRLLTRLTPIKKKASV